LQLSVISKTSVAWEIARLLSLRSEVPDIAIKALEALEGSNAESAPNAIKIILGQGPDEPNDAKVFKDAFVKEISAKVCGLVN
jgi:RNA-dependent RNA polymerase